MWISEPTDSYEDIGLNVLHMTSQTTNEKQTRNKKGKESCSQH